MQRHGRGTFDLGYRLDVACPEGVCRGGQTQKQQDDKQDDEGCPRGHDGVGVCDAVALGGGGGGKGRDGGTRAGAGGIC